MMSTSEPTLPHEIECSRHCGYVAPQDLLDRHEREDHGPCAVCGQHPRYPYPVAHSDGCTRLAEIRAFEAEWVPPQPPLAAEVSR